MQLSVELIAALLLVAGIVALAARADARRQCYSIPAVQVHDAFLATLNESYGRVLTTDEILSALS